MKKTLIFGFLMLWASQVMGQELQLHYDFLKERQYLTGTFEIFKVDKLGSTFFFTDFDFNRPDGASLAYFEVARKFNIKNKAIDGLNFHIEYNDGLVITKNNDSRTGSPTGVPISRSFLVGLGLPIHIGNFTLHTSYLYKNIKGSDGIDGQFTAVWFQNFLNNKITFRGFLDVWSEGKKDNKKFILITEPQILYNLNETFSLGIEIEISNNFVPSSNQVEVFPTIMMRWNL